MPGSQSLDEARVARRAAMRRATLHLVLGVGALDAVAIGLYYAFIVHAPERTRMLFTGVWTLLTAILVAVLLKRVRRARYSPTSR
jgi:hypothetical protein